MKVAQRGLPKIYKALVVATEQGIILEAKGDIKLVCGWSPAALVAQNISVLIPRSMREAHIKGMEHYHDTGEGPVIGKTLALHALGPDDTLHPIWLTVFGYEKYSEQIYGLVESRK